MKKILYILPVLGILSSCNAYLDMTPKDSISDKVMWATTESAEYAVNSIYSYAYDIYASWPSAVGMTEAFTDEFKYGSYVNFAYCLIPSQVAYGGTNLTNSFVDVYLGCWVPCTMPSGAPMKPSPISIPSGRTFPRPTRPAWKANSALCAAGCTLN